MESEPSSFFFYCWRLPCLAVDLLTVPEPDSELDPLADEPSLTSRLLLVTNERTDFCDQS